MSQPVNIQRDFLGRWLELETEGGYYDDFELRLLKRGREGILPLEPPLVDCPPRYRFHTDCCRPLTDWLSSERESRDLLPVVLKEIVGTYYQLCQYMLCSERICLEPSLIFIDAVQGIHLLYLPEAGYKTASDYQNRRLDTKQRFLELFRELGPYLLPNNEGLLTHEQLYERYSEPYISERGKQQRQFDDIKSSIEMPIEETVRIQDTHDVVRGFPGLDCLKTRGHFIRLAVGILLYQLLCIGIFIFGLICIRQITGDLAEARLGWGLIVLGIDLLGLRFLVAIIYSDRRKPIRVIKTIEKKHEPPHRPPESPLLETELLALKPLLSENCMNVIEQCASYAFLGPTEIVYRFDGEQALVGRNKQLVQWCLEDPTVGRQHARLELIEGKLYLSDLGSKNGTYVNAEDIRGCGAVLLTVGDEVSFAEGSAFVLMKEEGGRDASRD